MQRKVEDAYPIQTAFDHCLNWRIVLGVKKNTRFTGADQQCGILDIINGCTGCDQHFSWYRDIFFKFDRDRKSRKLGVSLHNIPAAAKSVYLVTETVKNAIPNPEAGTDHRAWELGESIGQTNSGR